MRITKKKPATVVKSKPMVGNIYMANGGRRNSTHYWAVVGMSETGGTLYMMGFTAEGEVSSTASYNTHAFADREVVGSIDWDLLDPIYVEWY